MRFIPTKVHGLLDYVVAVILILTPWMLDFAGQNAATFVLTALGFSTIAYSFITDYEWGVVKLIVMPLHLAVDLASGILLALSPWVFGFSQQIYLPHLLLGILEVLVSLFSIPVPYESEASKLMKKRARFL